MWSLIAACGGLGTLLTLVVWALKAYTTTKATQAINAERQAGRDAQQNEANNEEIDRVNRAADASSGVRTGQTDAYDEAGK